MEPKKEKYMESKKRKKQTKNMSPNIQNRFVVAQRWSMGAWGNG